MRPVLIAIGILSSAVSTVIAGPAIATNTLPVTAADVVGSQIAFKAAFSGTSPITYQWQVIKSGATNNISGATNTTLTLTNLQLTDAASYRVQSSNVSGTTLSAASPLTVNSVPAPVNNIIAAFAAQTGLGAANTNFVPTWTIASNSLIAALAPSSVGSGNFSQYGCGPVAVLTDGSFGSINYWPNVGGSSTEVTCGGSAGQSVTYTLATSGVGYALSNIVVYGGWGDAGRDEQAYTISYSTITNPTTFVTLTSVSYNPANPSGIQSATRANIYSSTAAPLATKVAAVKFDFTSPPPENGFCGYSEIQLFGSLAGTPPVANTPTSVPGSPVVAGTMVAFNEAATGVAPIQYQWQTDNGSVPSTYTDIPGATGSNYVLNTASIGGFTMNYRVRVTDANGTATSPALALAVSDTNTLTSADALGNMRCEHLQNPFGLDVLKPRLSWEMSSTQRGDLQTAWQVLVATSPSVLATDQGDLWNSGRVPTSQSVLAEYAGQALTSGQLVYWKVRVWDANGNPSAWSPTATWSMGLLNPADWTANWIGMTTPTNISPAAPSPVLRKAFSVTNTVARATAYICGLGYYELQLNGAKVGDHLLDPSWTRYDYHAYYVTYDVTTNLLQGANAVGVQLANAFYNQWSSDAWNTATAPWRALPQLLFQMDIQYTDGTHDYVLSDSSWKAATGPLLLDATRLGEVYDARLEMPGWSTAGYDDSAWTNAILREGIAGLLLAPDAEPVKLMQTVVPVRIIPVTGQPGVYTFDFGQNLVGWGQLNVTGPAGTAVKMVYGEKTNSDGTVDQSNINYLVALTQYFQTDQYTLKGGGPETWEPRFTYHGFRYAQVTGLPAAPTTNTLLARVVRTSFDQAGSFLCANDLLNRIETNTLWSYQGDFVGIPTDCPTREKNGWTGDAQLACEIGLTHFHSEAAYTRWIREFGPAQMGNGELSGVFPNANWGYGEGPAWESAYLLIPWFVYQHCGDARILTNNYLGMKAYTDYCTSVASGNIVSYGLGDWEPANTAVSPSVTDTGYYYQNALIVAQTAAMMGNTSDSIQYSNLAAQIKVSFNNAYYNSATSQYAGGAQTAQSCVLYQGMADTNQIPAIANALSTTVQQNNNNIDTGILGSKYILRSLCDSGRSDTAWALATQTTYPSWGYQIVAGATTLWETWSGSGSQDSLNHIMFGDISAWFIEYVAGIRPGAPGYQTVIIKPEVMNELPWAQATHDSPYGAISNAWQLNGQSAIMTVTIPPNATALVYIPMLGTAMTNFLVRESGTTIWQNGGAVSSVPGVVFNHLEGTSPQNYAVWTVASGTYQFTWQVDLQAPRGLAAYAGNQQVRLLWNPVANALGYNVKRSRISGGPYAALANGLAGPDYVDLAVTNGGTYYYVVSALTTNGESVNSLEAAATPVLNLNFGFETPSIGGYEYNPSGAIWTFNGASPDGSGISANNSGFTSQNPPAPQGTQVAFVQAHGSISQLLAGFSPGTPYTITFSAAQRAGGNQHGGESWNVQIDGSAIASYNPGPSATSYVDYTASFTASSNYHTLAFAGTDLATGDNTVFIDNIRIVPPLPVTGPVVNLTSPINNSSFSAPASLNLAATVITNNNFIQGVQFFANAGNFLAQVTNSPYLFAWTNVSAGNYQLTARVVFNGTNIVDSAPVNIVVSNVPPVILGAGLSAGNFFVNGSGQPGQTCVLLTATNLSPPVSWSPVMTNVADGSGKFSFTNLPAINSQQFYRILTP